VAAGKRSYPVRITRGSPALAATLAELTPSSVLLVTDRNVARHHEATFPGWLEGHPWRQETLDPGEASKSEAGLGQLWRALLRAGVDRKGLVLAVGGGVVTDLAGLAAGTWLRGVRWVAAPSTLLGMVDAAVGGKTAIDLEEGKNVVGLFHQPSAVVMEIDLLATEPRRGLVSGLAEVVKTALIGDAALLTFLEEHHEALLARDPAALEFVVRSSVAVKAGIVSRDEQEQGERRLLNLGHTLGHALEAWGGFARWTHGEAVALGLVAALRVGAALGVTEPGLASRVERLLAVLGLPWRLEEQEVRAALPLLGHDKKRERGEVHLVLVERPGQARTQRIALDHLGERLIQASVGGFFSR
jgi:3-dehydroquinate synthase